MTDQVRGFRDYLATIEAEQIQIEEDLDIFSTYLSWAAAFGIVDRWVTLFEQLEAEGRWSPDPMWYPLYGYGYGYHHNQSVVQHLELQLRILLGILRRLRRWGRWKLVTPWTPMVVEGDDTVPPRSANSPGN